MENVLIAFLFTFIAGISTAIGGLIVVLNKTNTKDFLSISLGFSAGVMIYISFVEILPNATEILNEQLGNEKGYLAVTASFFLGIFFIAIIDALIPKEINPHEFNNIEADDHRPKLMRVGLLTALAVTIHNFPEGLATFLVALQDPALALPILIAIAIHNIPEGIAIAMPIYHATASKKKAFLYSLFSGLAEPIGALFGWLILMPFMNDTLFGMIFASIAGIMVFISLDELLPAAHEYGEHHLVIYGLISGMAVMAISLILI